MNESDHISSPLHSSLALVSAWAALTIPAYLLPIWARILIGTICFIGLKSIVLWTIRTKNNEWSLRQILAGITGAILGLVIANLVIIPAALLNTTGSDLHTIGAAALSLALAALFSKLFIQYEPAILQASIIKTAANNMNMIKLLDSSTIIDGRISGLTRIQFVEGLLVVPGFILDEIKRIADSDDELKRQRGKLALKTIIEMIDKYDYVVFYDTGPETEVDNALVLLALKLNAKIVTSDANLIELAKAKSVPIININELSEAVQMIHLRGEKIKAKIKEAGANPGQGKAYTEDGTMIVVTNGDQHMGETVDVIITRHLQSKYGIILFADII